SHVILPYDRDQFVKDDAEAAGSDWAARCRYILDRATEVATASPQAIVGGNTSLEYGFRVLDGMATIRAEQLDTELICLALWDGKPGDGPGGTAMAVAH